MHLFLSTVAVIVGIAAGVYVVYLLDAIVQRIVWAVKERNARRRLASLRIEYAKHRERRERIRRAG